MDNNIRLIDQRLSQLRALIPRFREHSLAAENRLANEIITWELNRIKAIQALEKKLGELRALIPVYKTCCPAYEHVLAEQIIDLDLQIIEAKSNKHLSQPRAPHSPAAEPPVAQPIQSKWPEFLVDALAKFRIFIGNQANPSALQSKLFARSSICLSPTPFPTSTMHFLEPESTAEGTFTNSSSSTEEPPKYG